MVSGSTLHYPCEWHELPSCKDGAAAFLSQPVTWLSARAAALSCSPHTALSCPYKAAWHQSPSPESLIFPPVSLGLVVTGDQATNEEVFPKPQCLPPSLTCHTAVSHPSGSTTLPCPRPPWLCNSLWAQGYLHIPQGLRASFFSP